MASAAFPSSNLILDGGGGGGREKFISSRGLDHMEFDPGKLVDEDFLFSNYQQQEHSEQISFIDHGWAPGRLNVRSCRDPTSQDMFQEGR